MQRRTLASLPWIVLGLMGCSAGGGGTNSQPGGAANIGGSLVSTSSTIGGQTSGGGAGGSTTSATSGINGGAGGSTGGHATGGNGVTGGTSTVTSTVGGQTTAGGTSNAGGTSSNAGGSSNTGGSKAVGGTSAKGGTPNTGGSAIAGGVSSTGGSNAVGGGSATGGNSSTAGGSTSAGATSTGGSTSMTLNGCTATISDATLQTEYTNWKKAYVVDCSTTQARVQAGGSAAGSSSSETFSEGIGYGMLLAVEFNDQATFDKLWAYYKAALDKNGLMNWKMNACTGNYYEANGASDGDLDTAMALVLGDRKWGGYTTDANALLDAIRTYETMTCGSQTVLRPGDAWGLECTTGNLNPSYFSPGYYRAFALYQSSQATFWNKFADDTVKLLLAYQKTATSGALMGEWGYTDRLADTSYGYNACRTPWRVAIDYVWWGSADSKTFLTNVSTYVDSNGGVSGVPFDKNSAFLGPFALSGIATGKCADYYQSWMSGAQYDDRYFQGTLRVLAMLLMAGKFTF